MIDELREASIALGGAVGTAGRLRQYRLEVHETEQVLRNEVESLKAEILLLNQGLEGSTQTILELRAENAVLERQRDYATGVLNTREEEVDQLKKAIRSEHVRSNGISVYMNSPQHERSIARCHHPLCEIL